MVMYVLHPDIILQKQAIDIWIHHKNLPRFVAMAILAKSLLCWASISCL